MPSLKIVLKVPRLADSKVKLKLEIESNPAKPIHPNNSTRDIKKMEEQIPNESLPLFDYPEELVFATREPSFWRKIPIWLKFWQRH